MVLRSCLYERQDESKKRGEGWGWEGGGREVRGTDKREKKTLSFLHRTDIGLLD